MFSFVCVQGQRMQPCQGCAPQIADQSDVDELFEGMPYDMVEEAAGTAQDDDGIGPTAGGEHAQDLDLEALLDSVDCEVVCGTGSRDDDGPPRVGTRDDDGPPRVGTAASRGQALDLSRMVAAMHLGGAMTSELTSDEVASVAWFKARDMVAGCPFIQHDESA